MSQAKPIPREDPIQQYRVLLAADLKNSVFAELDAGNLNRIAYSPYGQQSVERGVMTRLGFNGELREVQAGWYLLGNGYRAYNPGLMRFHSPDSLSPFGKGGLNAYMYCGGEPVMSSDPTGHIFGSVVKPTLSFLRTTSAQMFSKTANTVNNAVSQVVGAARSVKKVLTDIYNFRANVIAKIGSPPPKPPLQAPPPNHVLFPDRYKNPYANPHISRQPSTHRARPSSNSRGNTPSTTVAKPVSATTSSKINPVDLIRKTN